MKEKTKTQIKRSHSCSLREGHVRVKISAENSDSDFSDYFTTPPTLIVNI